MLPKHHSQLSCNHYSTIYDTDLQTTIRIARLYWRTSTIRAALAQPFPYHLHRLNGTTQFAEHIAWMHYFQCTKCPNKNIPKENCRSLDVNHHKTIDVPPFQTPWRPRSPQRVPSPIGRNGDSMIRKCVMRIDDGSVDQFTILPICEPWGWTILRGK
jgi:hypothetical protein